MGTAGSPRELKKALGSSSRKVDDFRVAHQAAFDGTLRFTANWHGVTNGRPALLDLQINHIAPVIFVFCNVMLTTLPLPPPHPRPHHTHPFRMEKQLTSMNFKQLQNRVPLPFTSPHR